MRFLCLSDIHGNGRALRAVMAEAETRGYQQIVACGDLLFPGPDALEVWQTLARHSAVCVQGASDRAMVRFDPDKITAVGAAERERLAQLRRVRQDIGDLILARVAKLEPTAVLHVESGATMVIVHGSPVDPLEPITADMSDDEILALLGEVRDGIVVCGASHVPFTRTIGEVHVVNVGSVGEAPRDGFAHATLLDTSPFGVTVDQFEVEIEPSGGAT